MSLQKLNVFLAWFLIPISLVLGWIAFSGRMLLELLNVSTAEGGIPGIIVGMLLWFAVLFTIRHLRGELWPIGQPAGNGFVLGQRLVMAANVLALCILTFRLTGHMIENRDVLMLLDKFTDAFGYWVMGMWAIGFSFLYQSAQTNKVNA